MTKTKVYARNKQFTGARAGVTFVNGVAETDDKSALDWFKSREGYSLGKSFGEIEVKPEEQAIAKPKELAKTKTEK